MKRLEETGNKSALVSFLVHYLNVNNLNICRFSSIIPFSFSQTCARSINICTWANPWRNHAENVLTPGGCMAADWDKRHLDVNKQKYLFQTVTSHRKTFANNKKYIYDNFSSCQLDGESTLDSSLFYYYCYYYKIIKR